MVNNTNIDEVDLEGEAIDILSPSQPSGGIEKFIIGKEIKSVIANLTDEETTIKAVNDTVIENLSKPISVNNDFFWSIHT